MAKQDTTVGETELREGDHIWLIFAAANRDPEMFSQPDTFSVDREKCTRPFSFRTRRTFLYWTMLGDLRPELQSNKY